MDLDISLDSDRHRFVAAVDGREVGFIVDHRRGRRHLLVHTEVDDDVSGRGVASTLVRRSLDDVRDRGDVVVPICPFVAGWIERHTEYDDLVDHAVLRALGSVGEV